LDPRIEQQIQSLSQDVKQTYYNNSTLRADLEIEILKVLGRLLANYEEVYKGTY
jgi:hypothetical protein